MSSDFADKLKRCKSIPEIFELVKTCVEKVLNLSRGGIMIGMQDMPSQVLSYHPFGSNIIILNKRTISKIACLVEDQEVLNSLLFYAILHGYLRSLGIIDENIARYYASEVCEKVFGCDHILTFIAKNGLEVVISELDDDVVNSDYSDSGDIIILKSTRSSDLTYI